MKQIWPVIFLMTASLSAMPLEISGYFESQFTGASIDNTLIQLQSNKLRLDFEADVSEALSFKANYNIITFHGKTQWHLPDYLPEKVMRNIPEQIQPFYTLPFNDTQELDNAFIKWRLPLCDITLGKQQLSFGTGYAWNPLDLFNQKDLLDPAYEQPGHNAIRMDLPLTNRINTTFVYTPEENWNHSGKLFEIKMGLPHFDLSLMAMERRWKWHDFTVFDLKTMNFEQAFLLRRMAGGSLMGEIIGWGLWAEAGFNTLEHRQDFTEWLIGTDHTFDSGTYVMAEFYQNTQAKENSEYNLNDWMRYLSAEQRALGRDQCYFYVQHPLTDLMQLGFSAIVCVSDGSTALLPTLNWSPQENMEILAYLNLYQGNANAAFNARLGNGGLLRARIYF